MYPDDIRVDGCSPSAENIRRFLPPQIPPFFIHLHSSSLHPTVFNHPSTPPQPTSSSSSTHLLSTPFHLIFIPIIIKMGCVLSHLYVNSHMKEFERNPPKRGFSNRTRRAGLADCTRMVDRNPSCWDMSDRGLMVESLKDPKNGRTASRGRGPGAIPEPTWKSYPRGHEARRGRVTGSEDTIQNFQPRTPKTTPAAKKPVTAAKKPATAAKKPGPVAKPLTTVAAKKNRKSRSS
jgi:hypothetical protein